MRAFCVQPYILCETQTSNQQQTAILYCTEPLVLWFLLILFTNVHFQALNKMLPSYHAQRPFSHQGIGWLKSVQTGARPNSMTYFSAIGLILIHIHDQFQNSQVDKTVACRLKCSAGLCLKMKVPGTPVARENGSTQLPTKVYTATKKYQFKFVLGS